LDAERTGIPACESHGWQTRPGGRDLSEKNPERATGETMKVPPRLGTSPAPRSAVPRLTACRRLLRFIPGLRAAARAACCPSFSAGWSPVIVAQPPPATVKRPGTGPGCRMVRQPGQRAEPCPPRFVQCSLMIFSFTPMSRGITETAGGTGYTILPPARPARSGSTVTKARPMCNTLARGGGGAPGIGNPRSPLDRPGSSSSARNVQVGPRADGRPDEQYHRGGRSGGPPDPRGQAPRRRRPCYPADPAGPRPPLRPGPDPRRPDGWAARLNRRIRPPRARYTRNAPVSM